MLRYSIVEDNRQATNSPNYKWRLTDDFLAIIHSGRANKKQIQTFLRKHSDLQSIYTPKKNISKIPITINGNPFELSKGKHNQLQKAIIEEFASRFAKGSECLYVGDTTKKDLFINDHKLQQIGFNLSTHNTLPDIILYDNKKQWLYFIEAVTSVGPMDAKRVLDITKITKNVNIGKIFVTAFPDMNTFKRFSSQLAWDTEVWIAEYPDHMIHLNGDRFIGPR